MALAKSNGWEETRACDIDISTCTSTEDVVGCACVRRACCLQGLCSSHMGRYFYSDGHMMFVALLVTRGVQGGRGAGQVGELVTHRPELYMG